MPDDSTSAILTELHEMRAEVKELREVVVQMVTRGEHEDLREKFHMFQVENARDLTRVETKAGLIGALAGTVPVAIALGVAAINWLLNG